MCSVCECMVFCIFIVFLLLLCIMFFCVLFFCLFFFGEKNVCFLGFVFEASNANWGWSLNRFLFPVCTRFHEVKQSLFNRSETYRNIFGTYAFMYRKPAKLCVDSGCIWRYYCLYFLCSLAPVHCNHAPVFDMPSKRLPKRLQLDAPAVYPWNWNRFFFNMQLLFTFSVFSLFCTIVRMCITLFW